MPLSSTTTRYTSSVTWLTVHVAVARFAEPLALTSVFPYLPEMIKSFGVDKKDVAKWAGLTGAIFSVSQSITAVPWGKASDRIGRKPIILIGLISTMICFLAWGMSTSLPMAITVRAIMGGGNGNGMFVLCPPYAMSLTRPQSASSEPWWRKWYLKRSSSQEPSPSCPWCGRLGPCLARPLGASLPVLPSTTRACLGTSNSSRSIPLPCPT